ncbi:MAG: ATP-dependent DNA helicase RecG [Alphaproteobacteria bacterium]|nr:ATP-dependent DNA helicase RecG [Alphaproteobacteria bacterium]
MNSNAPSAAVAAPQSAEQPANTLVEQHDYSWFGQPVTILPLVTPPKAKLLARLGISTIADLLFHLPSGIQDFGQASTIAAAPQEQAVTLTVEIVEHRPPSRTGRDSVAHGARGGHASPYRIGVRDGSGVAELVFFKQRASAMLQKLYPIGATRVISGELSVGMFNMPQIRHPTRLLLPEQAAWAPRFQSVYPTTPGLPQWWWQKLMTQTIKLLESRWRVQNVGTGQMAEWLPTELLRDHRWPDWLQALRQLHQQPRPSRQAGGGSAEGQGDARGSMVGQGAATSTPTPTPTPTEPPADPLAHHPARLRLAFDELLAQQLTMVAARASRPSRTKPMTLSPDPLQQALALLPFALTPGQQAAVDQLHQDLASPRLMNRLVQGDVGCGKTVVAFLGSLPVLQAGGQVAILAPTTILAAQHAETLRPLAAALGYQVGLFQGGKRDQAMLTALAEGGVQLAIGTHALLEEAVRFAKLQLVVIDEQHRFGVKQRLNLLSKGAAKDGDAENGTIADGSLGQGADANTDNRLAIDLLVMSATPIPRSLALTFYGDMEVTRLTDKPPGRQPISTRLFSLSRLSEVLDGLGRAIAAGSQAYWVCPLVSESEKSDLAAAEARFAVMQERFDNQVGMVHGRQKSAEKQEILKDFRDGKYRLLVATTVIEVGVDVPAATIMVVESAERFGLSQLHQLRGRVGRGTAAGSCMLLYGHRLSALAKQRLEMMRSCQDGFALAEADLNLRGAGDMLGLRQSGQPLYRLADLAVHGSLVDRALAAVDQLSPPQLARLTKVYQQLFPHLQSDWQRTG